MKLFFTTTKLTTFLMLSLFAAAMLPGVAQGQEQQATVQALMAEGNNYLEKTFDDRKALETYEKILQLEPKNYEALWRASRALSNIAWHMPTKDSEGKKQVLAVYSKALDYAEKAIASNPNGSMGYTQRAVVNGRIALFKGVWESIDLVKKVKADCEKALALDPNDNLAWYVFGRTHMKAAEKPYLFRLPLGLGWANMKDAIKDLETAVHLRPNFIMYRLDLARAYIEEDEYAKAREQLQIIPSLPTLNEDDGQYRQEAARLLKEIQNK